MTKKALVTINGGILSWKAARLEIEQNTDKGEKILDQLRQIQAL